MTKKKEEETALVVNTESAVELTKMVEAENERRAIMTEYISKHMVKGTDFGGIHIAKNCQNKYNCSTPSHFSKDCLFKPGAEKFTSLMKLSMRFKIDRETWEMAGSLPGLFCYVCELVNPHGEIVGEGRGACSVQEKGNANTAIKIAQKRAQIDAVLRTGGLSDFFTQDIEDMHEDTETGTTTNGNIKNELMGKTSTPADAEGQETAQEQGKVVCSECGTDEMPPNVVEWSMNEFGKPVCFQCQKKLRAQKAA